MGKSDETIVNDEIVTETDFKPFLRIKEDETMAMEITNSCDSVYENTYAAQKQQETAKQRAASKREVLEIAAAQKNSGTESSKAKSTAEYMKELEKLAPSAEFRLGKGCATDKSGITLTIHPDILKKMQNDPAKEKKMKELIGGVESMLQLCERMNKATGRTTVFQHCYIDANGNFTQYVQTIRKDELNEKLRREAEENAKKQIEKNRENARKKAEQIAEQSEEKAEEAKKTEDSQEQGRKVVVKPDTAQDKAQKLLLEKLENADDGEIYFNDDDMKIFMDAAKEEAQGQTDKTKNPVAAGGNFDMQI